MTGIVVGTGLVKYQQHEHKPCQDEWGYLFPVIVAYNYSRKYRDSSDGSEQVFNKKIKKLVWARNRPKIGEKITFSLV